MELECIKVGDKFSTEAKMVVALGLEVKKGKARELQMNEVRRYVSWDKTGLVKRGKVTNEIVITEVREIPTKKVDRRVNNGGVSKYAEYIDQLVVQSLVRNNNRIVGSMNTIFTEIIPIMTQEWIDLKQKGSVLFASKYKVAAYSVDQYDMQVSGTLKNMFDSSLNRLQKLGVLKWRKDFMVSSNKLGKMLADEYELGLYDNIIEIEEKVLLNQGITRKEIRFNDEVRSDFYSDTQLELQAVTGGEIWSYYGVYNIELIEEPLIEYMEERVAMINLTNTLLLSIHNSLSKKHKDGEDFYPWLTHKLAKFVVIFEHDIFSYSDGKILDGDVFAFSSVKIKHIFDVKKQRKEEDEELSYLPF